MHFYLRCPSSRRERFSSLPVGHSVHEIFDVQNMHIEDFMSKHKEKAQKIVLALQAEKQQQKKEVDKKFSNSKWS